MVVVTGYKQIHISTLLIQTVVLFLSADIVVEFRRLVLLLKTHEMSPASDHPTCRCTGTIFGSN
jgi:hypothetical protein